MISNCKMHAQKDPSRSWETRLVFPRQASPDRQFVVLGCMFFSNHFCNALGLSLSYGVLLPALMDYFDETRERTGE